MTTPTPDPADPRGGSAPAPDLDGQQLLDAGADEAEGTAAEDMAAAADEGDARLRAAESSQARLAGEGGDPQQSSASRGAGAGSEGGPDTPGQ